MTHWRHHEQHEHLTSPFGSGGFGAIAEKFANFFGTPQYIVGQTVVVIIWILLNVLQVVKFDLYPFILLNLAFSTQAAYAAPLILLAQTRAAARDKAFSDADAQHREELNQKLVDLLQQNTTLTEQVKTLTDEIHSKVSNNG